MRVYPQWAQITCEGGGASPPEFGVGTVMQIVPRFSKHSAHSSPKHAISSEKFIFSREGYSPIQTPPSIDPTPRLQPNLLDPPLCPSRIPARLIPMSHLRQSRSPRVARQSRKCDRAYRTFRHGASHSRTTRFQNRALLYSMRL